MARIFRLTPGGGVPKLVPVDVSATPATGQVTLSWDAPTVPAGATVTGYEYTLDGGATWVPAAASPVVLSGLTYGDTRTAQVRALASVVGVATLPATGTIPLAAPQAPTGVSVEAGDGTLVVTFTAPADTGGAAITGYEASTDDGITWAACSASPATLEGLTNDTAYTVKVRALNSVGEGVASSGVAGTPALPSAGFIDLFDGTDLDPRWTAYGGTWSVGAGLATPAAPDGSLANNGYNINYLVADTGGTVFDVEWEAADANNHSIVLGMDPSEPRAFVELFCDGSNYWGLKYRAPGSLYANHDVVAIPAGTGAVRNRVTVDESGTLVWYRWGGADWVQAMTGSVDGYISGTFAGPAWPRQRLTATPPQIDSFTVN